MQRIVLIIGLMALSLGVSESGAGVVHGGGVGSCSLCHGMHVGGSGGPGSPGGGSSPALLLDKPSEICLGCHAGGTVGVMGGTLLAPAPERGPGNFVFLLEDNINDGPDGVTNPISGDAAGHNIDAPGYGISSDGTYAISPGGSYPAMRLGCTSCHDPHGNQSYRMLRGTGSHRGFQFSYPAPDAEGLPLLPGAEESDAYHVAYRSGVSRWCANCHSDYLMDHNQYGGAFEHPTDESFESSEADRYNRYNGDSDPAGGTEATAYLAAVPFEDAGATPWRTAGPTLTSRLNCLSCHRAHASSAPHAGRWDFNVPLLDDDGLASGSYPLPNPYADPLQGQLCAKCHSTIPN